MCHFRPFLSGITKKKKTEGDSLGSGMHFETGEHVSWMVFYFLFFLFFLVGGEAGVKGGNGHFLPPPLFVCVVNPGAAAGPRV